MGKAEVTLSWELVKQWLQLPNDWRPVSAHIEPIGAYTEPTANLHLIVSGESIPERSEWANPIEMVGNFHAKTIDGEDGRWIKGEWSIYPKED